MTSTPFNLLPVSAKTYLSAMYPTSFVFGVQSDLLWPSVKTPNQTKDQSPQPSQLWRLTCRLLIAGIQGGLPEPLSSQSLQRGLQSSPSALSGPRSPGARRQSRSLTERLRVASARASPPWMEFVPVSVWLPGRSGPLQHRPWDNPSLFLARCMRQGR